MHDVVALGQREGLVPSSLGINAKPSNVTKALEYLPYHTFMIFFVRYFTYCDNEAVKLCFAESPVRVGETTESEVLELMNNVKLNNDYKIRIGKDFVLYMQMRKLVLDSSDSNFNETVILEVKELNQKYPSKHFDWLNLIKRGLPTDFQAKPEDKIQIYNPQSFGRLNKMFEELEET